MSTKTKEIKASQNGAAKKETPKKVNNNGASSESELKQVIVEPKPVDINDRVQKIKEIKGLTEKRERTLEILNELREFRFSSDDSSELVINDAEGRGFKTLNSNLIEMLTSHLESLLTAKGKELEEQIISFEI